LPVVAMFVNGSGKNEQSAWPNESKLGRKHPWKVLYENMKIAHLVTIR
jgi:hypothetical protein